jgi:hypothetical protein
MSSDMQEMVSIVDDLYHRRADLAAVRESVVLMEQAVTSEKDYELCWRLARSLFFLGQEAKSVSEGSAYFKRGVIAAKNATGILPDEVAGRFWLGVTLALSAQTQWPLNALRTLRQAKRALSRAKDVDETYHGAGPHRVLGRIEHKMPRLLGGSRTLAKEYYERALTISPENTVTRMFLAELLLNNHEPEAARDQLNHILTVDRDPEWEFEIRRDQLRAAQMLQEF